MAKSKKTKLEILRELVKPSGLFVDYHAGNYKFSFGDADYFAMRRGCTFQGFKAAEDFAHAIVYFDLKRGGEMMYLITETITYNLMAQSEKEALEKFLANPDRKRDFDAQIVERTVCGSEEEK